MLPRIARRDACTSLSKLVLALCAIISCISAFVGNKPSSCNEAFLIFGAQEILDCRLRYSVIYILSMKIYSMKIHSMEIYSTEKMVCRA